MEGIDSNPASDLRATGTYIRKEEPQGPRQLIEGLHAAFAAELALGEADRARLAPAIRYDDPAAARGDLVAWLAQLHQAVAALGAKRLLVCIDGLDAMAEPGSGAFPEPFPLLDLLPSAAELPDGVLLLVTSRPAADCPAGLFGRIAARLDPGVVIVAEREAVAAVEPAEAGAPALVGFAKGESHC